MKINSLLDKLFLSYVSYVRNKYSSRDLSSKRKYLTLNALSDSEKNELKRFWHAYGINISKDINWVEFYSTVNGSFDKRFIPDNIYYSKIDTFFTNNLSSKFFDDKNLYDLIFKDVNRPHTIVRKMKGVYMDANYHPISFQQIQKLCEKSSGNLIIKPSVASAGGRGIVFWNKRDKIEDFYEKLSTSDEIIVQDIVNQHANLSRIHKNSLNTIRVLTLYIDNEVKVLSCVLRMGVNGNKVDNVSSGGISCGINADGTLKRFACSKYGEKLECHPQGIKFSDVIIPNFTEILNKAKDLAPRLLGYTRLVSWDFSLDENAEPVLIEANLSFGEVDFHQMNNGPVFGDLTEKVLSEVFAKPRKRIYKYF